MSREQAESFLTALDPNAREFHFMSIKERPEADPSLWHSESHQGNLDITYCEMERRNKHCGVFVTVNETDGSGSRKSEDIKRIRAVWQEDDNGYEGSFPLVPSLVVCTSPFRYHRYWLVEGHWPADREGRADFAAVMKGMVENYGSDCNAKDISRVLRVPGFDHLKKEQHTVKLLHSGNERYTREELRKAFGTAPSTTPVEIGSSEPAGDWRDELGKVSPILPGIPSDDRAIWLRVGMALHHLSGGHTEGFDLWNEWSRASEKYDPRDQERHWNSFSAERANPVTLASIYEIAQRFHGSAPPVSHLDIPKRNEEPVTIPRREGDLVARTIASVQDRFRCYGHSPSDDQIAGLEQVVSVVQGMAEGTLPNKDFYISFLPPGVGKTTTIVEAVRNLLLMEAGNPPGVIVFLSRVEEIPKLAEQMGLPETDFSVLVSERYEERELGNARKTEARVMFTTQQMVETRCRSGQSFAEIKDFHWKGRPREVRIWDEAILPARNLTLDHLSLLSLLKQPDLRGEHDLVREMIRFTKVLSEAADKALIDIPDIRRPELSLDEMLSWYHPEDRGSCEALWKLSGNTVRVRKDRHNTALDYQDILPADLGPMLILDASGQQRMVYELWYNERKGLSFLPSPQKCYSGLTIHHWDRGSGAKARRNDRENILDGVVKAINAISPDEPVLVMHFKRQGQRDVDWEREIRSRIMVRDNVSFCTWGRHTATNDFCNCPNVILAGILQYPTSQNEATARGAKGISTNEELTESDFEGTRLGEIAHNIFQAACRGSVRRSEGDKCPEGCRLFVIFSTKRVTGVPKGILSRIFPGSTLIDWRPVINPTGRVAELIELVSSHEAAGAIAIPKRDVIGRLGIDKTQLSGLLRHPDFKGAMEQRNIPYEVQSRQIALHL